MPMYTLPRLTPPGATPSPAACRRPSWWGPTLAAALSLAATGCGNDSDSARAATPPEPPPSAAQLDLDRYAQQLVAAHPGSLAEATATRRTSHAPEIFRTEFVAQPGHLVSVQDADTREQITEDWIKAYCTSELRDLLAAREVATALGVLRDVFSTRQHVAACDATPAPAPKGAEFPPLQDVGAFSTADICRAGFAVSFGREVAIMQATNRIYYVQIDYQRPTDGKPFSFRCRLENSHILSWDNRVQGTRWYGAEPTDWKVRYAVSGQRLRISTFSGTAATPAKIGVFTRKELLAQQTPQAGGPGSPR